MDKLRDVITAWPRWADRLDYVDRIEAYLYADFGHAVENAKALMESVAKEICSAKGVPQSRRLAFGSLLKKAFVAVGYANDHMVTQISGALANIGQQVGNLRNELGPASHGRTTEEERERSARVDELARIFLIDSTEIVTCFLIKTYENECIAPPAARGEEHIRYEDNQGFNEFWDETYGEFVMGEYAYLASEILFSVDPKAYSTEKIAFDSLMDEK